jgi:hypothetical protein
MLVYDFHSCPAALQVSFTLSDNIFTAPFRFILYRRERMVNRLVLIIPIRSQCHERYLVPSQQSMQQTTRDMTETVACYAGSDESPRVQRMSI